jgi:hypothetical protein
MAQEGEEVTDRKCPDCPDYPDETGPLASILARFRVASNAVKIEPEAAVLTVAPGTVASPVVDSSPVWDQAAADAILAAVSARLDALKAQPWRTDPQRAILEVFRVVFTRYHAQHNSLLFDALGDLDNQVNVIWSAANQESPSAWPEPSCRGDGEAPDEFSL